MSGVQLLDTAQASGGKMRPWEGHNGTGFVSDGVIGIARNRFVDVAHNTLPVLATSGVASWASPGVRGVVVDSVLVTAGTIALPTTSVSNFRVRYAIDSPNDAYSALILPVAEPTSSATADVDQVGSFTLTPVFVPDTEAAGDLRAILLILPEPVYIDITDPITRLDFAHNLGAGVTIQLGIRAVEAL